MPAIVAMLADDTLGATREVVGPPLPAVYAEGFRGLVRSGGRILLAVDGDEVVGCLQLNLLYGVSTLGQLRAQVEGVRVAGPRRGQGIGALLMRHVVAEARAAGAGVVQLTTNLSRMDAQRFYAGLGFKLTHAGMKLDL